MLTATQHKPNEPAPAGAGADDEAQCEAARLVALESYDILDTPGEEAFDRITRLARNVFSVPIAAVTFIDGHRQWFKSRQGVDEHQTCKADSFCNVAIRQNDVLVVPDALTDPRFAETGLVVGPPHIRFYAGAQLRSPEYRWHPRKVQAPDRSRWYFAVLHRGAPDEPAHGSGVRRRMKAIARRLFR
jgi:hypothetical protein